MCGENGASYIFGPQKGADDKTVRILDENLSKYADILFEHTGKEIRDIPGTGAAGGVLASLLSFTDCKIRPGIDIILDAAGFDEIIKDADLIVTGEGKFDSQSLRGKAVSGIAKRAKRQNKPVIVIAGTSELRKSSNDFDILMSLGIHGVFCTTPESCTDFGEIKRLCFENLRITAEDIAGIIDGLTDMWKDNIKP